MNSAQRDRILRVIDRDAEIQNQYMNEEGQFCIIGGLFDEVGVDVAYLFRNGGNETHFSILPNSSRDLLNSLGLSEYQLQRLQFINDGENNREERQEQLREFINQLPLGE